MYKDFFNLNRYPFRNSPDPSFFFDSDQHREALATMVYGVMEGHGFIMIAGEIGTGKTTLLQTLKLDLANDTIFVEIPNPWLSYQDMLSGLVSALKINEEGLNFNELQNRVRKKLESLHAKGRRVVLVIDEAHQLNEMTLEGLRLISNLETPTDKLIQIILVGQEELVTALERDSMRQLRQRISLSFFMTGLNKVETRDYISHRLNIAGAEKGLFSDDSLTAIYEYANGVPRLINQLCDGTLLVAFGKGKHKITVDDVVAAVTRNKVVLPVSKAIPVAELSQADGAPKDKVLAASAIATHEEAIVDSENPEILPDAASEKEEAKSDEKVAESGSWLLNVLLVLAVLLVVGLGAFWYFGLYLAEDSPPRAINSLSLSSTDAEQNSHTLQKPSASELQQTYALQASSPQTNAALIDRSSGQMDMPSAVLAGSDWPIPCTGDSQESCALMQASVSREQNAIQAASNHFFAWNDSVEDLVLGVNHGVSDLVNLPISAVVKLPMLTRQAMVVVDLRGRYAVYYGTFSDRQQAEKAVTALNKVFPNTFLTTVDSNIGERYRLYVGKFSTESEGLRVANTLGFDYLPSLHLP